MAEIDQLKERINKSGPEGVLTSQIRDDYEPIGANMIRDLVDTGEYVTRKVPIRMSFGFEWRIFTKEWDPS
jgi:hypothetical protein